MAILMTAGTVTLPVLAQQPTAAPQSVQVRYRHALDVFRQGKYDEARRILLELWNESRTYDVAMSLVQAEYQLGHYASAARYLEFGLANTPPTEKIEKTENYKKSLIDLQGRTARLTIGVDQPSADVLVDGEKVGTSPLAPDVYVEPGPHKIEARLGERKAAQSVDASRGSIVPVDLTLGAAAAPSPPFALATSPMPVLGSGLDAKPKDNSERGVEARTVALWTGVGVTAVSLGVGIGFALKASSASDDAKSSQSQLAPGACQFPANASLCAALKRSTDDRNSANEITTISFAVAGVAAVTTTAMFLFWPTRQAETAARIHVVPIATLNTGGLTINGNF